MPQRTNYDTLYRVIMTGGVHAAISIGIDGFVNWTNPVLLFMVGWERRDVMNHCKREGWAVDIAANIRVI